MQRLMFYVLFLSIFTLLGCSLGTNVNYESNQNVNKQRYMEPSVKYEQFQYLFLDFKDSFIPQGFISISPEYLVVKTVSFPENKLDDRQANTVDTLASNPTNFEQYYKDELSDLIVKVNFYHHEDTRDTGFIGINSILPYNDQNIVEEYRDELGMLLN